VIVGEALERSISVTIGVVSTKGQLLVASPKLDDPNFRRSVVLILDHDEQGAMGVVLNRPMATPVDDPLPAWAASAVPPAVVFLGGPVALDNALALADIDADELDGWAPLFDGVGTVDLARDPDELGLAPRKVRVFLGYSGWESGQLEAELDEGAWYVTHANVRADVFSAEPDELWRTVMKRSGGTMAWVANYPNDVTSN